LTEIHHRFLNAALAEIAAARGLAYQEWGRGWVVRVGDARRNLSTYGYQLSLNSALAAATARDKSAAVERLTTDGLPVVPTDLVLNEVRQRWLDGRGLHEVLDEVLAAATPPLIVKPNEGSSGDGVFLCRDRAQARRRVLELLAREPSVVVQPFLDLVSEERWVMLDGRPLLRYVKDPADPAGRSRRAPLFNLAAGATIAAFGLDGASEESEQLARAAAASRGLRVAAVDLVQGVDGSGQVLEVNSGLSFEHLVRLAPQRRPAAVAVYDAAVAAALLDEAPGASGSAGSAGASGSAGAGGADAGRRARADVGAGGPGGAG
jgi:glutathione synthase/RimK-type ligase-like ATP-grasp enzyme